VEASKELINIPAFTLVYSLAYLFTLKMEAKCSSKTSGEL
jgi:hypothetical protein